MNWKSIGSFKYMPDFNNIVVGYSILKRQAIILKHPNGLALIKNHGGKAIRKGLDVVLERLVSNEEGDDIHLGAFFATN